MNKLLNTAATLVVATATSILANPLEATPKAERLLAQLGPKPAAPKPHVAKPAAPKAPKVQTPKPSTPKPSTPKPSTPKASAPKPSTPKAPAPTPQAHPNQVRPAQTHPGTVSTPHENVGAPHGNVAPHGAVAKPHGTPGAPHGVHPAPVRRELPPPSPGYRPGLRAYALERARERAFYRDWLWATANRYYTYPEFPENLQISLRPGETFTFKLEEVFHDNLVWFARFDSYYANVSIHHRHVRSIAFWTPGKDHATIQITANNPGGSVIELILGNRSAWDNGDSPAKVVQIYVYCE